MQAKIEAGLEPIDNLTQPYRGAPQVQSNAPVSPSSRILGLRRTTFWLSFALILFVLAASIAGGLGGGLHKPR
jgi:hypothetical protein